MELYRTVRLKFAYRTALLIALIIGIYLFVTRSNINPSFEVGQAVDSLNHVTVFYNGGVGNVEERNLAPDGYNLGLKYQCVEFVKRYYYEHLNFKMPDSYGHAKSFFDYEVEDGELNERRGLLQFSNPSSTKPAVSDLVVFKPSLWNRYGHVAIVSAVSGTEVEIIQQNPGPFGTSRERFPLLNANAKWKVEAVNLIGWLRKEPEKELEPPEEAKPCKHNIHQFHESSD